MKKILLFVLLLCGCAGSMFSHKTYSIRGGKVTKSTAKRVETVWFKDDLYYGNHNELFYGNIITNVCPENLPEENRIFHGATLMWNKGRHCWIWNNL